MSDFDGVQCRAPAATKSEETWGCAKENSPPLQRWAMVQEDKSSPVRDESPVVQFQWLRPAAWRPRVQFLCVTDSPGPSFFKLLFQSEKWSHKNLSDSIFLTSFLALQSVTGWLSQFIGTSNQPPEGVCF